MRTSLQQEYAVIFASQSDSIAATRACELQIACHDGQCLGSCLKCMAITGKFTTFIVNAQGRWTC